MSLSIVAKHVAEQLKQCQTRVVFAESCTGGLVAARLARIAGISEFLCGSAVTYRNDTKHRWLAVPLELLSSPGPVSKIVAEKMVRGILQSTPEADLAAAVTGHLGPGAPVNDDGLVYVAIARRSELNQQSQIPVEQLQLRSSTRVARQREAAERVLDSLLVKLRTQPGSGEPAAKRREKC